MGRIFGTMLGFFWVFYFTFSEDKQKDKSKQMVRNSQNLPCMMSYNAPFCHAA